MESTSELVLVTGGTGYLASWCVAHLLEVGYRVRATVRSASRESAVRTAVEGAPTADPTWQDRLTIAVADLTADAGWTEAMSDVDYVLHVASPLGGDHPGDEAALIGPAREGTIRVLRAAVGAGVRRIVMTSSCAAATPKPSTEEVTVDETQWTNPDEPGLAAYRKSKVLAERAAWDFMRDHGGSTELTTVLPGAVLGPALPGVSLGSLEVLGRLVRGEMPGYPRISLEVVDVRDLADLHLRAMTAPEAAGGRFIGTGELLWMGDVCEILRDELGPRGARVPRHPVPSFMVKVAARFNGDLATLVPLLGRKLRHSPAKAERVLGWRSRPAAETIVDSGEFLLDHQKRS